MPSSDKTKEILEQILAQLHQKQAKRHVIEGKSYLIAQNNQFLGNITSNLYDSNSILNKYGTYGSKYSPTSIFNKYSEYGSKYGVYSINNPYCSRPPKLFIKGNFLGYVSVNKYINNRIPTNGFLYTLENKIDSLLEGKIFESESHARQIRHESYIEAADGTFLGKLTPNKYDIESIFNKYGPYGNQFSQFSILNKFSTYGGNQFSPLSPYNQFSSTPPKLFIKGEFVAYLTTNPVLLPSVHPDKLFEWAEENISRYV
ncbi:MAG: hypothetical protein KJ887_01455 [Candidatus Omnitrophica bacterium]|nr:hypothetical protein [Candidatus Omnitrophota bacterium]MBU1047325.1 hypothetical protein [Candidatus Omnitrophota bacterium]MBU1630652.1 hypothetical protein [Candidatus Omnitrophota bacterium]MBU1767763.1 hypothetical protein [Candidatus Omnitrophota bacterium]MBU1889090.1 hypothetical protein [Candidatus Omnitrophota bacterium]